MFTTPHWARCCWESLSSGWMGFTIAACGLLPLLKLPLTGWQLPAPLQARVCRCSSAILSLHLCRGCYAQLQSAFFVCVCVKLRRENQISDFSAVVTRLNAITDRYFRSREAGFAHAYVNMREYARVGSSSSALHVLELFIFMSFWLRSVFIFKLLHHVQDGNEDIDLEIDYFCKKIPFGSEVILAGHIQTNCWIKIYKQKQKRRFSLSSSVVRSPQCSKLKSTAKLFKRLKKKKNGGGLLTQLSNASWNSKMHSKGFSLCVNTCLRH